MATYRKLPSGKWQATVWLPGRKRVTRTDVLKSVVKDWAVATETESARGKWRDPRKNTLTVGQWHAAWTKARRVEAETARADEGSWRLHLEATFGDVVLADLTRNQVQAWVKARSAAGVGPSAIRRALNLFKAMLEDAVTEDVVEANAARKVSAPTSPKRPPDWFTAAEVDAITAAMREAGRESAAVMTELMTWAGLRWGEAAALRGSDVDWLRKVVTVHHVLTQGGADKAYPKNSSSVREVPVPGWVVENMAALLVDRDTDARIFVTRRQGRALSGANWRREFDEARKVGGVDHGTPHTCRHTCASWLVQAGVPLYEVQRQLGHSSMQTTQVYAHLAPDAHTPITDAWVRLRA